MRAERNHYPTAGIVRFAGRLLLLFVFLPFPALFGESVILKNGTVLTGAVVSQTRQEIRLSMADGKIITISKMDVARISYVSSKTSKEEKTDETKHKEEEKLKQVWEARRSKERQARLQRDEFVWNTMHMEYRMWSSGKDISESENDSSEESYGNPLFILPEPVTTKGILLRNMAYPGWGDYYAGNKVTGYAEGGLFALASFNFLSARNKFLTARNAYNGNAQKYMTVGALSTIDFGNTRDLLSLYILQTMDSASFNAYNRSAGTYNNSLLLFGVAYLGILAHSFFIDTPPGVAIQNEKIEPIRIAVYFQPAGHFEKGQREAIISGNLQFRF